MVTYNVVDDAGVIHGSFELENENHLDLIHVGALKKVRADAAPSEEKSVDDNFVPPEHEDDNTEGAELATAENGTAA